MASWSNIRTALLWGAEARTHGQNLIEKLDREIGAAEPARAAAPTPKIPKLQLLPKDLLAHAEMISPEAREAEIRRIVLIPRRELTGAWNIGTGSILGSVLVQNGYTVASQ